MATIKQVRKAFEDGLQAISALDQDLADEQAAIEREAFLKERSLTDMEEARSNEITETRQKLSDTLKTLALETVEALENADDVKTLLTEIKAVNQGLDDDLASLKSMEIHTKKAANVVAELTNIAKNLANLVIRS